MDDNQCIERSIIWACNKRGWGLHKTETWNQAWQERYALNRRYSMVSRSICSCTGIFFFLLVWGQKLCQSWDKSGGIMPDFQDYRKHNIGETCAISVCKIMSFYPILRTFSVKMIVSTIKQLSVNEMLFVEWQVWPYKQNTDINVSNFIHMAGFMLGILMFNHKFSNHQKYLFRSATVSLNYLKEGMVLL